MRGMCVCETKVSCSTSCGHVQRLPLFRQANIMKGDAAIEKRATLFRKN